MTPTTRTRVVSGLLAAGLALGLVACSGDDSSSSDASTDDGTQTTAAPETSAPAAQPGPDAGPPYTVALSGAGEVPGPGAEGASGTVTVTLDPTGEVCVIGEVTGLGPVTGAILGSGGDSEETTEADIQIDLGISTSGGDTQTISVCAPADAEQVADLASEAEEDPSDYFVSLRTAELPDGAVRGQLAAA